LEPAFQAFRALNHTSSHISQDKQRAKMSTSRRPPRADFIFHFGIESSIKEVADFGSFTWRGHTVAGRLARTQARRSFTSV
jgi:hypothetical protein